MKKVLVTGVSKGIGQSIAKQLLSEGYFVVGTYNTTAITPSDLSGTDSNCALYKVDFSVRAETMAFLAQIQNDSFYGIVNNAGMIDFESWNDFSMELWDKTMEVNLNAPVVICHALRNAVENGGSIVNIASTDGNIGSISSIAYSASKAALINVTKSLTNVFAPKKVRVNAVTPGWVGEGMDSPAIKIANENNPLGRTAKYEEIAYVVSFLLSEKSGYVNGTSLVVDGGDSAVSYVLKKESELTTQS